MNRVAGASRLGLPYVALCALCALVAQLAMEVSGLCGDEVVEYLCERHIVLLIAIALCGVIVLWHGWSLLRHAVGRGRAVRNELREDLRRLPFGGQGWRFLALTSGVEFGFGVVAHIGEGSPVWFPDALSWLIGALIVAVVAAVTTRSILRALPELVAVIAAIFLGSAANVRRTRFLDRWLGATRAGLATWPPQLWNRPPPLQALHLA